MKQSYIIIGLIIICGGLLISTIVIDSQKNQIKADLKHFKESSDRYIEKELIRQRMYITDSITAHFESLPPDTVIKNKIQHHYEKVTDTVFLMPSSDQFRWSAKELERLYENRQPLHFKSGPID